MVPAQVPPPAVTRLVILRVILPTANLGASRCISGVVDGRGKPGDLELLASIAHGIAGNTICALGDAAAWPMLGFLTKFRADFEAKLRKAA